MCSASRSVPADGIVQSSAKVMAVKMLGGLSGFIAILYLARTFGSSSETDAYFIGRFIPFILATQLARALLIGLIPVLSRIQTEDGGEACRRATGSTFTVMAIVLPLLSLVLAAVSWPVLHLQAPGFDRQQYGEALKILLLLLPLVSVLGLLSVLDAYLNVNHIFLPGEIALNMLSVGTLAGVILLSPLFGVVGVAAGSMGGALLGFVLIFLYVMRRHDLRPNVQVSVGFAVLKSSYQAICSVVYGISTGQLLIFFAQAIATTLGSGTASLFNYATRLATGFPLLAGMAIGKVLMPRMVQQADSEGREKMSRTVTMYLRGVCFFFAPYALLFFIFRDVFVRLFFSQSVLSLDDFATLSALLAGYSPAILFASINNILIRSIHSVHASALIFRTATAFLLVGGLAIYTLVIEFDLGVAGLAIAFTLASAAQMLLLAYFLSRRIGSVVNMDFGSFLVRMGLSLIVASVPAAMLLPVDLFSGSLFQIVFSSAFSFFVWISSLAALLYLLRVPEWRRLCRLVLVRGRNKTIPNHEC